MFIKRLIFIFSSLFLLSFVLYFYRNSTKNVTGYPLEEVEHKSTMNITSPQFNNNELIPVKYTCDGEDISPPLEISDVPADTNSLVLVVDDPDAPGKTWVHWVVFNISPDTKEIIEGEKPENSLEGITDFGDTGYGGPCPPSDTHRYFFKLYAVDKILELSEGVSKNELLDEIENHIIEKSELIGLYQRN